MGIINLAHEFRYPTYQRALPLFPELEYGPDGKGAFRSPRWYRFGKPGLPIFSPWQLELPRGFPSRFPGLPDWLWTGFLARLRDPIRVWRARSQRCVVVLGCVGYYLDRETGLSLAGKVDGEWLDAEPEGDEFGFPLRNPEPVKRVLEALVRERFGDDSEAAMESRSAFLRRLYLIHRQLRGKGVVKALQARVRLELGVDEQTLRLALRARRKDQNALLEGADYRVAHRNRVVLQRVHQETPNLLPLVFHALRTGVVGEGSIGVVGRVKAKLREAGISERVWHIVARTDRDVFDVPLGMSTKPAWDTIIAYCRYLDRWQARQPIPAEVLRAIHCRVEPDHEGRFDFDPELEADDEVIAAGLQEYLHRAPDAKAAFIRDEFLLVRDWAWVNKPKLDANQKRAGWHWLVRTARAWEEEKRMRILGENIVWSAPLERYEAGGFVAVALTSRYSLWEEGRQMRHCAEDYTKRCALGPDALYSIRGLDGRRLATACFVSNRRRRQWSLSEVQGFANSREPAEVAAFAKEMVEALNRNAEATGYWERARTPIRIVDDSDEAWEDLGEISDVMYGYLAHCVVGAPLRRRRHGPRAYRAGCSPADGPAAHREVNGVAEGPAVSELPAEPEQGQSMSIALFNLLEPHLKTLIMPDPGG